MIQQRSDASSAARRGGFGWVPNQSLGARGPRTPPPPPPPPSSPCPSHPLPPPCPPTPPLPCPRTSCPPLPPPLTLTPLLLWLLISSKFSIVYQTKQRLKALLCCSPHCKLLNRPECLEIWLFVCCRLMLWDFTWEVCATTEHCV